MRKMHLIEQRQIALRETTIRETYLKQSLIYYANAELAYDSAFSASLALQFSCLSAAGSTTSRLKDRLWN